jgi:hypothetical protein
MDYKVKTHRKVSRAEKYQEPSKRLGQKKYSPNN